MSLAAFFAETATIVAGARHASPDDRGGAARIEFYAWLVDNDLSFALERRFVHVKRALDAIDGTLWSTLAGAYRREYPPDHWDVTRFGDDLPAFLGAHSRSDERLRCVAEIAEFQLLIQRVGAAPDDASEPLMDQTLFIRRFDHRVPQYCGVREGGLPQIGATVALIYRSLHTRASAWFIPSQPMLVELGRQLGLGESGDGQDEAQVLALTKLGIIPSRRNQEDE